MVPDMIGFTNLVGRKRGYRELSEAIIEAIESGQLTANTPLPPTRVLAESLNVSRDTVVKCYKHLTNLGWIKSYGARGTFIAHASAPSQQRSPVKPLNSERLSGYGRQFVNDGVVSPEAGETVVFSAVPKQFLPVRRWRLATQDTTETLSNREPLYDVAVLGRPELREALSAFINLSRGILSVPAEIAVFNVSFNALVLMCRLFMEPGDYIAVEEPGYGGVKEVAFYLGLKVIPIKLDGEGMIVNLLESSKHPVKMVYVTPNHQEPTGVTMSSARRKQLVSWAQRKNAIIIEDDYDGLFHYGTSMPPSLKSMDAQDNVIFIGSLWQVLYPLTTLCFCVIPLPLIEIVKQAKQRTVSLTESSQQLALTELLTDGYLQKHIRKLEREFSVRRRTFIYELKRAFGPRVNLPSHSCGLTLLARFEGYSDEALLKASRHAELPMVCTDVLYTDAENRSPGEWCIYFPSLDERAIKKAVHSFVEALSGSSGGK
jgi:GntR family transcriptional regulator / MocR family aminotransferase